MEIKSWPKIQTLFMGTVTKLRFGWKKRKKLTKLGEEEDEHDEGGSKRDQAAGESAAVEVVVDLGVSVQVLQSVHHASHCHHQHNKALAFFTI